VSVIDGVSSVRGLALGVEEQRGERICTKRKKCRMLRCGGRHRKKKGFLRQQGSSWANEGGRSNEALPFGGGKGKTGNEAKTFVGSRPGCPSIETDDLAL